MKHEHTHTHTHKSVVLLKYKRHRTKCNTADAETDRETYYFAVDKETDREADHSVADKETDRKIYRFAADRETDRETSILWWTKRHRGRRTISCTSHCGGGSGPLCSARMRRHLPRHTSDCTNSNMPAHDHQQPHSTHQFMNCVPFQGKKLNYQINEINAPFNEFWLNTDLSAVTVLVQWDWCNFYELWLIWLKTSLSVSAVTVSVQWDWYTFYEFWLTWLKTSLWTVTVSVQQNIHFLTIQHVIITFLSNKSTKFRRKTCCN